MQYRPTAGELLTDVAMLLDSEVLEAVSGPLQHRVRVAASPCDNLKAQLPSRTALRINLEGSDIKLALCGNAQVERLKKIVEP